MTDKRLQPHAQKALTEKNFEAYQSWKRDSAGKGIPQYRCETTPPRVIRRPQVEAMTGLSRSTLYDWMKRGEFPQPIKLGARLVAWRESDVIAWLENRETRAS
ncbi:MAG: helix-turn-helix transcriptional regulator [Paracoccaceae bacterium]